MKKTLNGQWVEVFRAGDYGDKGKYTQQDLDQMVMNYNAAEHEAPIVIGHPKDDAPAFGWIQSLKRQGSLLFAKLQQVQPEFEEMVRSGKFKKRSIAFYKSANGWIVRHVGFLGAMPPEVKGLADVRLCEFRDAGNDVTEIQFEESEEMDMEKLKAMFSEALDNAIAKIKEVVRPSAAAAEQGQFSEDKLKTALEAAVAPFKQQFTEMQGKIDEQQKEIEKQKGAAQSRTFSERASDAIAKLKASGKYVPAFDKMGVPQIFAELAKIETKVSFGEGDKKTEKTPVEIFAEFMEALPKIVPTGEIAKAAAKTKSNLVKFTEPKSKGFEIDQDSVAFAEAAQALSTKEKISFGDAMKRLRAEGWQAEAGAAAAGSA